MAKVRVFYTLAPHWSARQWLDECLELPKALGSIRKVLEGEVTDDLWRRYSSDISWTLLDDGTYQIRTDAVPVKTMLDGKIILRSAGAETIHASLDLGENRKTWHAGKPYLCVEDLLSDLHIQVIHDLANPMEQQALCDRLSLLFTSLWKQKANAANLDVLIEQHALELGKVIDPYHTQMRQIDWTFQDSDSNESYGTPFEWRGAQPLQWEVIRCLYYVVQGFHLMDDSLYVPWTETLPVVPEYIDVSFLRTRVLSVQQRLNPQGFNRSKFHPGDVVHVEGWLSELKEIGLRKYPDYVQEHTLRVAWNAAVLIDYGQRLLKNEQLTWSFTVIHDILKDKKYREQVLQGFSPSHLNHNTYLDEAIQFWEHGAFVALGGADGKVVRDTLGLFKAYFTWLEAKNKGMSSESIEVYNLVAATEVWNKVRHTDVAKKFEPYYRALGARTPDRYFVTAPSLEVLRDLKHRFPNFSLVTRAIEKHLRLLHLQDVPVLDLPSLLLVGGPGLGKTRYLNAVADILKAPIHEIAMSSLSAGFVLAGSDFTWQSAKPGKVADAFLYDVCANPLFILDEIDKVSGDTRHDPYGPLYQLLEKHTAKKFMDEALRLEIDTSGCSWLATANSINTIPEPILSRFQVFYIPELSNYEIPVVAQSIFDDLRSANRWGSYFEPLLQSSVFPVLFGLDARAIYFALRDACANAAIRSDRPLVLRADDFEFSKPKRGIGFLESGMVATPATIPDYRLSHP